MQIVIDIPDDFKDYIEDVLMGVGDATGILVDAVMIGKPLPKGHGRLIDADKTIHYLVYNEQFEEYIDKESTIGEYISMYSDEGEPETILEADKEVENDD